MTRHPALALLFLLAAGGRLPAQDATLELVFTGNPSDWKVVADGYSDPAFTPLLKITDTERDGRFLGILLEKPPGDGTVYYLVQAATSRENPEYRTLKELSLTVYGTDLPFRVAVLLGDGSGRSHEFDLGTANFPGARRLTHTVNGKFGGLAFKALVIYLDASVPIGDCVVFIGELSIRGGSRLIQ
ncbi:MAG: hypothetical protein NT080_09360 [Spirochaetes bacterium]|nr:hypothetical protein [Spirochaetota bacterium]